MLTIADRKICSIEVATAICVEKPSSSVIVGTIRLPPPTPNRLARNPTKKLIVTPVGI
ncbi:hypothetical protein D3C72_1928650 [compost metagenome]